MGINDERKDNFMKNITKKIYPPECGANASHRWLAEVRENGWLMSYGRFDTERETQNWLNMQTGAMNKAAADFYLLIMKEKALESPV